MYLGTVDWHSEADLEKLAINTRRTPQRVLSGNALYEARSSRSWVNHPKIPQVKLVSTCARNPKT
jgi:hypothetical protein